VFLLGALVHTLFDEGLVRSGRVAAFTDGVDEVRLAVAGLSPEAVADRCRVSAAVIRRLAREFAAAPSAVAYGRVGVTQSVFGTTAYWFLHCLNLLTGNLDQAGGAMFARPAFDLPALSVKATDLVGYDRWRSRVSGHPEFAAEFPSSLLAEEILTPGPGRIRGLVLYAGNPVLSVPDGRAVERALGDLEFCASVDFYLNESNRHADVILPPVPPLERDEFDVVFPSVSVRNWARWNPAVLRRTPGARDDADLLLDLTQRVHERLLPWPRRTLATAAVQAQRRVMPRAYVDLALRIGPWGARRGPGGLSLKKLRRHPHGLDLGALEPALPARLFTRDGRIDLAPAVVLADIPRVVAALSGEAEAEPGLDLLLIGRRHLRGNNSWMHNLPRLAKGGDRCTLLIHPQDAASRGLADGDRAELASRIGSVVAPVEVTDAVMPGVVSLPHGYGHDRGAGWSLAARQPGVSANDLTDATRYDPLSGNAAVQGTPVRVCRAP
jgi:anaerobic selenocysteine-containing dehydrogenase